MKKTTENHAEPKAAAKKAAKTVAKTATKRAVKAPAKAATAPAKKAPGAAKKTPVAAHGAVTTVIAAQINIGHGNHLYIRGTGPDLSWDLGLAMECVNMDLWAITVRNATQPIAFKVLINDRTWSVGEDFVAEPGSSLTVVPTF